jgi:hypothetical protein
MDPISKLLASIDYSLLMREDDLSTVYIRLINDDCSESFNPHTHPAFMFGFACETVLSHELHVVSETV